MCSYDYVGTKTIEIRKFVGKCSYVKIVPIYVLMFSFSPKNFGIIKNNRRMC
jgi:hypothetical protein